jgi:hypothetical protein
MDTTYLGRWPSGAPSRQWLREHRKASAQFGNHRYCDEINPQTVL